MIKTRYIFLLLIGLISCRGMDTFVTHDRSQTVTKKSYSHDTLHMKNYMLCNYLHRRTLGVPVFEDRRTNEDSVIHFIADQMKGLGLDVDYTPGVNLADTGYCHREVLKIRDVSKINFSGLGIDTHNKRTVIPIVKISDLYRFTGYMTSNMVAGDGGFVYYTFVSLIVLIVENDEVIYSVSKRYASAMKIVDSLDEVKALPNALMVEEKHMNRLVEWAMEDYVKRLKK